MDKQLRSLVKSFAYAFKGLWHAISTQRNMRIHFTAAFVVLWLSCYFELTASGYVSLIVTIGMVISAELFNTAIEAAVDRQSKKLDSYARIAKDTAAAAVLICAFVSLGVAGVLFFNSPQGFERFFQAYFTSFSGIIIILTAAAASTIFIFVPPHNIAQIFKKGFVKSL